MIAGSRCDPESVRVACEAERRGVFVSFVDTGAFPEHVSLSGSAAGYTLERKALPHTACVYIRSLSCHPLMPDLAGDLAQRPRGVLAQCAEKRALLESWLLDLARDGVLLVNGLEANAQHSRKPHQLGLLHSAGLPVPPWLATNDPRAVRDFMRAMGKIVYKPLAGGATVRMVTKADLSRERLAALAAAPVLFQQYVPGTPVRVYVVGRKTVAAAEIHSSEIDYRRKEESVVPVKLTAPERHAAVAAARACGMTFTGVDLIRTAGGFSVLECNPSPMFAVFEKKTGADVAGPLTDFLCARCCR